MTGSVVPPTTISDETIEAARKALDRLLDATIRPGSTVTEVKIWDIQKVVWLVAQLDAALGAAVTPTPQDGSFGSWLADQSRRAADAKFGPVTSTPEAATEATEAIAAVALDELSSWDELAEAMGAELVNHEQGCSGEYETTMEWPDGRVARSGDVLQIVPSYPTVAASGLQRATEHDWFGRREPEGHVTFCRICGGRFENVRFVNCPGRATEKQQ